MSEGALWRLSITGWVAAGSISAIACCWLLRPCPYVRYTPVPQIVFDTRTGQYERREFPPKSEDPWEGINRFWAESAPLPPPTQVPDPWAGVNERMRATPAPQSAPLLSDLQ
jgi:hypothetical protein